MATQSELGLLSERWTRFGPDDFYHPPVVGSNLRQMGDSSSSVVQKLYAKDIGMLQSIKELYGDKLAATDGAIGHIKDFYFDDQSWAVRYMVVDTGSWLSERQVLISPHAIGNLYHDEKLLLVHLNRKQIEDSPSIELHKPVSRQYEEDYYKYYGFPTYWAGNGLWGTTGFPIMGFPEQPVPTEVKSVSQPPQKGADAHLRSTQATNGYLIQSNDGEVGQVSDFLINFKSWAIQEIVVKTSHFLTRKEFNIPTSKVSRISYEESTVFVNQTKEDLEKSPSCQLI